MFPVGVPVVAKNGDLYGVTVYGGTYNEGTLFKLTPPRVRGGMWTKSVAYEFPGGKGGAVGGSVILGPDGNFYGVGADDTIYELKPPPKSGDGTWKYSALYTLNQGSDGGPIQGHLAVDAEGNLFGATEYGGDLSACDGDGCGTVFELKRPSKSGGKWRFSLIHTFTGAPDGAEPYSGVTLDQNGNLYGTTSGGGVNDWGAVYYLQRPTKKGQPWAETLLYSFNETNEDITVPEGPVTFDGSGNLYGTTAYGGDLNCAGGFGCGVVFELSPSLPGQSWIYTTLYAFQGGSDGAVPTGYIVLDGNGNLYSTTQEGGGGNGYSGTAFRLSPTTREDDAWTETVLHRFLGPAGGGPNDGVTLGKWGDLYGVTWAGGIGCGETGCGTVFEVRP